MKIFHTFSTFGLLMTFVYFYFLTFWVSRCFLNFTPSNTYKKT